MTADQDAPARVEMRAISRRFGDLMALDGVDLTLTAGEIHALLGENGAGKTTLVNILFGLYRADSGEIRVDGQAVRLASPRDALSLGIGMVHQHARLVETFTVLENVLLSEGASRGPRLAVDEARDRWTTLGERVGLRLEPDLRAGDLSVGQRQRLEISKALWRGSRVLVLDEPTAGLAPQECEALLELLVSLARDGLAVAMITHQLGEVLRVAHRVTVLRHGRRVHHGPVGAGDGPALVTAVMGAEVEPPGTLPPRDAGRDLEGPRLGVAGLGLVAVGDRPAVTDIGLHVNAGEIVGVAGVDGNGQGELVEALVGLAPASSGRVTLDGRDLTGLDPASVRAAGVAFVPADRHRQGLVLDFTLAENLALGTDDERLAHGWTGPAHDGVTRVRELLEEFDVRPPDPHARARWLSGGNQQKVVLARALGTGSPRVLIVAHPARGLDVGAARFLHGKVRAAARAGAAVLWIGASLDELMENCHRILVMCGGRVMGAQSAPEYDRGRLGAWMAGVRE